MEGYLTNGGWNCENVWNLCRFAGHVGPGVLYSWNFLQLHHERCRLFFGTSSGESKFSRFHLLWMVFPLENPSGQHHVLNRLSWRQVCSMQTSVDWGNQWAPKMIGHSIPAIQGTFFETILFNYVKAQTFPSTVELSLEPLPSLHLSLSTFAGAPSRDLLEHWSRRTEVIPAGWIE